jgi:hypothetical protein
VRSAVDLRADHDLARDLPGEAPIPVAHTPLAPSNLDWPSVREGYVALLDTYRPQFARAAIAIARCDEAVVVHCQGGRDRTGILFALLLAESGVEVEEAAYGGPSEYLTGGAPSRMTLTDLC